MGLLLLNCLQYLQRYMALSSAIRKRSRHGLNTMLGIFLLTTYIVGTSQSESFHKLFHSGDHQISHTQLQEKDPCHRVIYHDDTDKGCDHRSHIATADKCDLCHVIHHTDQIPLSNPDSEPIQFSSTTFIFYSATIPGAGQSLRSSRAPPVV